VSGGTEEFDNNDGAKAKEKGPDEKNSNVDYVGQDLLIHPISPLDSIRLSTASETLWARKKSKRYFARYGITTSDKRSAVGAKALEVSTTFPFSTTPTNINSDDAWHQELWCTLLKIMGTCQQKMKLHSLSDCPLPLLEETAPEKQQNYKGKGQSITTHRNSFCSATARTVHFFIFTACDVWYF